jgi:hypothetical protein
MMLIAELADELERQWWHNHMEHCSDWPHTVGDRCDWPRPRLLVEVSRDDGQDSLGLRD